MSTVALRTRTGQALVAAPLLSERARLLGLESRAAVEREYQAAKEGWSKGRCFHCPFCDCDFGSVSGARTHMNVRGHRVLRLDWYDWLPPTMRTVRPGVATHLDGTASPVPPRRPGVPPALPAAGREIRP